MRPSAGDVIAGAGPVSVSLLSEENFDSRAEAEAYVEAVQHILPPDRSILVPPVREISDAGAE